MPPARLALAALAPLLGATAPTGTLTLPVEAPFVAARIAGQPVRLRVSFDAPGPLTLTLAAARRLGLRSTTAATFLVGPIRLTGGSTSVWLEAGGGRVRVQALWTEHSAIGDGADVDGVVGPTALPVSAVRLVRASAMPGRRRSMPAEIGALTGLGFHETIGGRSLLVRLAPERGDTIATAAAGALLASARGGSLGERIERRPIAYGIDRPVRSLVLGEPFHIATLTVRRLLVRTRDYAGATHLPADAEPESPDEIVVTGGNVAPGMALYRLSLGADVLGRCAEIAWDARAKRLTLDCPRVDGGETIR